MTTTPAQTERRLFAPIAPTYERWAAVLSLAQDGRWRRLMIDGLDLPREARIVDVASGTGSISRLLAGLGHHVVAVDLSPEMLARHPGPTRVLGRGETLPFRAETFDGATFGYLLRYVEDPVSCLEELARVVRPGGRLGMVEFAVPSGIWKMPWRFYAGSLLPRAGRAIGPGWHEVGRFLRRSIEDFHERYPDPVRIWQEAGLVDVTISRPSLGGGLVMWGRKP